MFIKNIAAQLLLTLFTLLTLFSMPAIAQNYVVNVHGIVCQFCSFGVAKKIRKLGFIDPSQLEEGVRVDIENQMVYVAIKDDAALDKAALFEAIESGGYKPVEIWSLSDSGEKSEVVE